MTTTHDIVTELARTLDPPPGVAPENARAVALLPCEPAVGEVAVACWVDDLGHEVFELVQLPGGERLPDATALREALTLLAMVETVEELASFEQLQPLADELAAWPPGADADAASFPVSDALARARASAVAALVALRGLAPGEEARVARPGTLDELGAALRGLERAWEQLEQAAELWCDELLAERGDDDAAAVELVQSLWRILGAARRGPLARAVSEALHAGREAGLAMAQAVSGPFEPRI